MANAKLKGFAVTITGHEELSAMFRALEQRTQKEILEPALKELAIECMKRAKARAPRSEFKRLGIHLADSFWLARIDRDRRKVGWRVMTGKRETLGIKADAKGHYPTAIEYGYVRGGRRVSRDLGMVLVVTRRGQRVRRRRRIGKTVGGKRIPARPFLRPALDSLRGAFMPTLARHIQAGLDRAAKTGGRQVGAGG